MRSTVTTADAVSVDMHGSSASVVLMMSRKGTEGKEPVTVPGGRVSRVRVVVVTVVDETEKESRDDVERMWLEKNSAVSRQRCLVLGCVELDWSEGAEWLRGGDGTGGKDDVPEDLR